MSRPFRDKCFGDEPAWTEGKGAADDFIPLIDIECPALLAAERAELVKRAIVAKDRRLDRWAAASGQLALRLSVVAMRLRQKSLPSSQIRGFKRA